MTAAKTIKVAISSEFMKAFAAIPKKMQSKVLEFITQFRNNPTASSINYEKINQVKDPQGSDLEICPDRSDLSGHCQKTGYRECVYAAVGGSS